MMAGTVERFGRLDVLVNNAADTSRGDVRTTRLEDWDRIHAINVRAPFVLMQAAVEVFDRQGGGGSIVNIGSVNAYIGEPKLTAYSASKGALMTLTRNAAAQLNASRIRVNQINAGWTLTEGEDRVKREDEGKGDEWLDEAIATRPFGRLLAPRDIAYAVALFRQRRERLRHRHGDGSRAVPGRRPAGVVIPSFARPGVPAVLDSFVLRSRASHVSAANLPVFPSAISTSSVPARWTTSNGCETPRTSAVKASSTTTGSSRRSGPTRRHGSAT